MIAQADIKKPDSRLAFFATLFLVSGAAGLIYEIIWERLLELYFGVTIVAITLIVSAYMGGLGLGSLFGGRLAQRIKSTLLVYGLVEIGIGMFGLFSSTLITWVGRATAGSNYVLVFCLSFLLLLVPTFLMGMTLPLLSQAFIHRVEISGRVIGLLYGINTLGAAFGALLAGYLLIGWSGFYGATLAAVVMNVLVGTLAILLNRKSPVIKSSSGRARRVPQSLDRWGYGPILLASFLVGFIGLGYEMLWIRILNFFNKSTVYGFPTILAVFLIGLSIGSYLWGRKADRSPDPTALLWKVEIGAATLAALTFFLAWKAMNIPAVETWIQTVIDNFQRPASPFLIIESEIVFSKRLLVFGLLEYLLPVLLIVLPTSIILGGGLPILDRIAIDNPALAGRRVGDVHLANISGSVFGALFTSFVLLHYLGSETTLKILVLLSAVFIVLYLAHTLKEGGHKKAINLLSLTLPVLLVICLPAKGNLYRTIFNAGLTEDVIVEEYSDSVLSITYINSGGGFLWIGGELNSFFPPNGDYEEQVMGCAGASQPKNILVIGLGGGNTLFTLTTLPSVEQIVVVELIKNLGPFISQHLPIPNLALHDPRVIYIEDDGRRYLYAHQDARYDMIIIDPLRRTTAGHDSLYSKEAFELYRSHLAEGGIFCLWHDESHIIPATLVSVFPEADIFRDFAVASNQPIHYDFDFMNSAADSYLTEASGLVMSSTADRINPTTVLSQFRRDRDQVLVEEQGTITLTDMNPYLEYYLFHPPISWSIKSKYSTVEDFLDSIHNCNDVCRNAISVKIPQQP